MKQKNRELNNNERKWKSTIMQRKGKEKIIGKNEIDNNEKKIGNRD